MATKKQSDDLVLGKSYFIRTVTHYYTGKLVALTEHALVLVDAAWIADTGRFSAALQSGEFSEVEPYPEGRRVFISRGAVLDVSEWPHKLPREVR